MSVPFVQKIDKISKCPAYDSVDTNTPANSKCASSSSSHMRSSCRAVWQLHITGRTNPKTHTPSPVPGMCFRAR